MKRDFIKRLAVLALGTLLLNACGKSEEKKETTQSAPTASAPVAPVVAPPPPALPAKFEDASSGSPLGKSSTSPEASFNLMAKNLGGTKWAKVSFESSYDYNIKNLQTKTPEFLKGTNENIVKGPYPVPSYHLTTIGRGERMAIQTSGNNVDRGNVYYFTYSIKIGGLTLYSTDTVALFRANSNSLEILKVNYTTATPMIQKFKIDELYNSGINSKWIIFQQNYETSVEFAAEAN